MNLNSTKNLVTLVSSLCCAAHLLSVRADWHLSFDHDDWAFVPAKDILQKSRSTRLPPMTRCVLIPIPTCYYLNSQPYPEFDPDELHNYVFVPLPTLRRQYIF